MQHRWEKSWENEKNQWLGMVKTESPQQLLTPPRDSQNQTSESKEDSYGRDFNIYFNNVEVFDGCSFAGAYICFGLVRISLAHKPQGFGACF